MSHRSLLMLCLFVLALASAPAAAQGPAPQALSETLIPNSVYVKFPRVAASGGELHVAANSGREHASYWARPAASDTFGAAQLLGRAEGHPDYSTASVTATPDGRLVYVWINQPQRTIFARVRAPSGEWGPARIVSAGSPFPVYVAVAATNSEFIAVWRDPDRPVVFSRSTDGGATWSAPAPISARAGVNAPAIAAGADGTIAVAYTQEDERRLQVFAGVWEGRGFAVRRITPATGDFADPGVAVGSDGQIVVSYRGVAESGGASGAFYAERAADGSWPVARLVAGKVLGPVSAAADAAGGVSLFWVGAAQGHSQIWFSRLPAGGSWSPPAGSRAASDEILFNVHGAVASGADGQLYAHGVSEYFVGDRTYGRAYRFLAGAGAVLGARPVIAGDAQYARATSLPVSFREIIGAPTELRWRWGAPPTDDDTWMPFAEQLEVAPPAELSGGCVERALFAQVRDAGMRLSSPASDTIIIDQAVQATLTHAGEAGAPGFTNRTSATLRVDASADCSGLATVRPLASAAPAAASGPVLTLTVPVEARERPQALGVELADALGNNAILSATVTYDATPPELAPGAALLVEPDPRATILARLRLEGVRYADGSGPLPWALAVSLSRSAGAPAGAGAMWRVYPLDEAAIQIAPDGSLALAASLSLADLLEREQITPGPYHYHVRLVDHAGNRSEEAVTATITLDEISFPRVALPLLGR